MNRKHSILAFSVAMAMAGTALAQTRTVVITEPEVRTIVTKAGYAEPVVVERDAQLWRIKTVEDDGDKVTVFVNAEGQILGAADVARTRIVETTTTTTKVANVPLDEAAVTTVLVDAGFHNVHDVDFRGNVWKAEADDITGEDFEIHVDANTGMIVHIEDD